MEKHMNGKIFKVAGIAVLFALFALVACSPETPTPPRTSDDSKTLSEISMLYSLGEILDDSDCNVGETITDMDNAFEGLRLIPIIVYGQFDGIWSEPYFLGSDGAKWYFYGDDDDEHEIILSDPQPVQGSSFELSVSEDETGNIVTEVNDLSFVIEETDPETRTLSVDLRGKVVSSETPSGSHMAIDITLNGRTYPTLKVLTDENGSTLTYGSYTHRHTHSFVSWSTDKAATDTTVGMEYSYCEECDFRTEREIPPSNIRGISLNKSNQLYDGKKADILSYIEFSGDGTPRIEFKPLNEDDSKYSEDAPIDYGCYSVRITVPADDQYKYDSVYEGSYNIDKVSISISSTSEMFDSRTYNGEKHIWQAILSSSNSGEGYLEVEGMPSGEEIKVTAEADSKNAGTHLFTYSNVNYPSIESSGTIEVEAIGEKTQLSNYSIYINAQPIVEPATLTGTLKVSKEYDGNSSFEVKVSDVTGLDGIVESDKEGLVIEMTRNTAYVKDYSGVSSENVRIMKNGEDITKNYYTKGVTFEAEVTPRKLKFTEFGDVLQTPYLENNLGTIHDRTIRLGARNGIVQGYGELSRNNTSEKLESGNKITFDSFYIGSSDYSLAKADCPSTLKVVSVTADISDLSTSFTIAPNEYSSCQFKIKQGEEIVIEGDGKDNVLAYVCNSSGTHYNVDYPNDSHTVTIQDGFTENSQYYLFLYSENGASNLTVGIFPSKSS